MKFSLFALFLSLQSIFCAAATYDVVMPGGSYNPPEGKRDYETTSSFEITPSAGPRVANGADVFFTADFLWWKAREEGLGYAESGFISSSGANPSRGKVHQPDFSFEPGFKVGLGLNLGRDGWDLFTEYTWLFTGDNRAQTNASTPASSELHPSWAIAELSGTSILNPATDPILFASSIWNLHFNTLDFDLGRNFYISQFLALRPHFGLKATLLTQKYRVFYTEDLNTSFKMRIKQQNWGAGIRGGIDTSWHLAWGFSIFGDAAFTALWTHYNLARKDRERAPLISGSDQFLATLNTHNHFYSVKGILEAALGARWEMWWSKDDYHFSVEAGWEEQIFWSFNQFINLLEEAAHGDLTLHGLTIKARFDF